MHHRQITGQEIDPAAMALDFATGGFGDGVGTQQGDRPHLHIMLLRHPPPNRGQHRLPIEGP
jgi:hypothetical protein